MSDEPQETADLVTADDDPDAPASDTASENEAPPGDADLEGDPPDDPAPGADPEEPVTDEPSATAEKTGESGAPGVPPPGRDERRNSEGLPPTTTTGDPSKDFRGPSVAEEARESMGDHPALDEPGYADLGHAEDYEVLRDD